MRATHSTLILIAVLLLPGCVTTAPDRAHGPALPERYTIPQQAAPRETAPEGTIYGGNQKRFDLYSDNRARSIGDILLVKIVETSSGKKKAETTTERSSTVKGGVSSLFGFEKWLGDKNSNFTPSNSSLNATLTNDYEGTGETTRNSSVTATLSARVTDVTMDGNLLIRGYREVRVNNETQFIILSGLVRPADISPDNSVLSSLIADARIEYSGKGVISDKQQPGWLSRGLDVIWPF